MSNTTIAKILNRTYDKLGIEFTGSDGVTYKLMKDSDFESENDMTIAYKVRTDKVTLTANDKGDMDLPFRILTNKALEEYKVISWQYYGNESEEIFLALENKGRNG